MVPIERFILPYPNLISVEGLGTLPEHCLRSLGKLLGQFPIFRRDCSSLPGNWNMPRRGMPGHSVFDGSVFIAVPCLLHVRLGLMMLVTLTHHSSITVISQLFPTLCQLLRGSRTVFSLSDTFRRLLPLRIISGSLALWSLLGIGCIAGPHSFGFRLWSLYSPLASSESEF